MENKTTCWMPQQEADALKEWQSKMTKDELMKTSYFFWNNFSMEGYEDWKTKNSDVQNKGNS